jgi:xanthine/CO dehydrogenase XdhC/CoxF family maturation factor
VHQVLNLSGREALKLLTAKTLPSFAQNQIQGLLDELNREPAAPHALATLVNVEGSSYRRVGARLLVNAAGGSLGTISGGCLESDVIERAREVIADGVAQLAVYNTTDENDLVWGTGTGCNGIVRILIERLPSPPAWAKTLRENLAARKVTRLGVVWQSVNASILGTYEWADITGRVPAESVVLEDEITPPVRLLIFGAGDDAQPLAQLAKTLGWTVEVFDARPAFAHPTRFPTADKVTVGRSAEAAAVSLDAATAAVVMTHRYRDDADFLRVLLPRELPYVGLLGPKKRAEKILAELVAEGLLLTAAMHARLRGPVGLDLGGDTPEAVALAVLAEIQSSFAGRDARPLRERPGPIHG